MLRSMYIVRWMVAGELIRPEGILVYLYIPAWQANGVLSLYSSAMGILQYPKFESRVEKIFSSPRESIHPFILSSGYVSLTVKEFSFL